MAKKDKNKSLDYLRKQAEMIARTKPDDLPVNFDTLTSDSIRDVLHELRVHQIELEMRNDELIRSQIEIDVARDRYFTLYNLAPIGYVTVSENGIVLEANLTVSTLLGIPRTSLIKRPLSRFILNEDNDIYYLHRRLLFKTEDPQICELRMIKSDGTSFWTRMEALSVQNENGSKVSRVVISDISAQKIQENELREKEIQYRNLADSGLALIWTSGTDKLCNYFNKPWMDFTGRTLEQEIGNGWADGVHPDDFDRCLKTYVSAFEKRESFDMDYRLRHKSGEYRWIRDMGTPNYNYDGLFIGYIGHCFDISEQKQLETNLRKSKEQLALALEGSNQGLWDWKVQTGETEFNERWAKIIGYSLEELVPYDINTWIKFTHPDDLILSQQQLQKHFARLTPLYTCEIRMKHKNGHWVWVMDRGKVVEWDADGKPVRMTGTHLDITERKISEEAVRSFNATLEKRVDERTHELQDAYSEMEAFTYSVAHDLRSPLRAIDGFAKILHEDYEGNLTEEGNRILDVVRKNAQKMDRLIFDLLSLSRISKNELIFKTISMETLIKDSYAEALNEYGQESFEFDLGPIPDTFGDELLIKQVWHNLFSNAIKYSQRSPLKKIEVGSFIKDDEQVYFVKDHGAGFNPAYTHQLFGVFQRLHSPNDFEGNGIGLTIVKRIITRHNGKVWAEGKVNEGATFYFSLPIISLNN